MEKEKEMDWSFQKDVNRLQELLTFWNKQAIKEKKQSDWYKEELAKTQEILGRVTVQFSERWDTVQLTNYPRKRLH